jgi:hypothetical protein
LGFVKGNPGHFLTTRQIYEQIRNS